MTDLLIQPPEPNPFEEETREFWRETGRGLVRQSIGAFDETAKQVMGVAGILVGLFFNAVALGDLRGKIQGWELAFYLAPIVCLVVSVAAALKVYFPSRYPLNLLSSAGSKTIYEKIFRRKRRWLLVAAVFLVLGILGVLAAMFLYLAG
jgi:predicted MFS family arabinose efflux permease